MSPLLAQDTVAALDLRLAQEQARCRLPSVAAALVRDGRTVWSGAAGTLDATPDGARATSATQYRIGSITKTLVATQVMRLVGEGRVSLSDRIGEHLPELDWPVTVAQLLTHTSGLEAENRGPWWERTPGGSFADLVSSRPALLSAPGTRFHYSNTGFAVLGELVARLRGASWEQTVRGDLLVPLGMTRTSTRPDPAGPAAPGWGVHPFADVALPEPEHDAGAFAPAGQLWASVEDLARWAVFAARGDAAVLDPELHRLMRVPVAVSDVPEQPWGAAHGLGWQVWNVDGRRFVGHGGSMPGFLAGLRVDVESGDGVVVLCNATSGLGSLATDLLTLLTDREPIAPTPWTRQPGQSDDLALAGDWFFGTTRFTLRLVGGRLRLGTPGVGRGAEFVRTPDDPDTWIGTGGYYAGEPLTVHRGGAGSVTHLQVASFVFTRTPYDPAAPVPGDVDPRGWF